MADLKVDIGGLKMAGPVMLASGILGETAGSMLRVFEGGAGAVVTKSVGLKPRSGHANPTFLEVTGGYINAMGLPNPGMEGFAPEVLSTVENGAVVVGSIFGDDEDEYATLATLMQGFGVAAVELNLSCPHASGTGMELGTDPGSVRAITAAVGKAVDIPVFVKLTPNITDIRPIASAAVGAGADALVVVNTLKAIAVDASSKRPVLGNVVGGFSGPALKHIGLRMVWDIYGMFHVFGTHDENRAQGRCDPVDPRSVPIIGVGGIETGEDAAQYILAGASAVQVGSNIVDDGPRGPGRISGELDDWMDANGFGTVPEFTGLAHRNVGR
jgi:dihydroorotate dehydrogenase (NAD+) catalytic subunit